MMRPRTPRSIARTALVLGGGALTATAALAFPSSHRAGAPLARVVVRLTSLQLEGTRTAGDSLANPVLVFAAGPARVGLGLAEPTALADTLRLFTLPAITVDVTESDVHLQLGGPGRMTVRGDVSNGPAAHVSATGRHIVLLKGGVGIRPAP